MWKNKKEADHGLTRRCPCPWPYCVYFFLFFWVLTGVPPTKGIQLLPFFCSQLPFGPQRDVNAKKASVRSGTYSLIRPLSYSFTLTLLYWHYAHVFSLTAYSTAILSTSSTYHSHLMAFLTQFFSLLPIHTFRNMVHLHMFYTDDLRQACPPACTLCSPTVGLCGPATDVKRVSPPIAAGVSGRIGF